MENKNTPATSVPVHPAEQQLRQLLAERILVLDGAMGTMIQQYKLDEAAYRAERFANHGQDVKGNNELLSLTQPQIIGEVHEKYLAAGADLIETNTFGATSIAQADYEMPEVAYEMNLESARIARAACDKYSTPDKPRFVAGALGPQPKTASISPDVNDPGARNVTFEQLRAAYHEQARGLIDGGVDVFLVETIFDTLNAKAALFALDELQTERAEHGHPRIPIMISGTVTDASGRILSGQTVEAFWNSVRHANPISVGLNCALGPDLLRQYVEELSRVCETFTSVHPNAGLPNEFGEYDLEAPEMAKEIIDWGKSGFINIVGGCCGTTPAHIKAFAKGLEGVKPRQLPELEVRMRLSGLEACNLN